MNRSNSSPKSTTVRVGKFAIIGAILALFNFAIYTFLARIILKTNELLWLDSIISYALATVLAYILHSKITWKERHITKRGIIMFFFWNGLTAIAISPFFTWLFGFITPIYEFAFNIFTNLHIPFDYNFVESTGVFCFTTAVTMVLNYLFYDKLVFGDTKPPIATTNNTAKDHRSKISIIVPIYNTGKYLKPCLNSIISQTHKNLEIILVDDGSTDDSSSIIKEYAKKDKRIVSLHQNNQGQSAARNTGLSKATGSFVSFIDSDDQIKSSFIEDLFDAYNDSTAITVCGIHYKRLRQKSTNDVYINPIRPKYSHESTKSYILYLLAIDGRMYSSVNKLYRADLAKKCHFDEKLNFAEDTKFVLDYLKKTTGDINFVLKPLYIYNFGTETSTINSTALDWNNWQSSYQDLKSWLGKNPSLKEKFWLHTVHLRWRISHFRSKRRAKKL